MSTSSDQTSFGDRMGTAFVTFVRALVRLLLLLVVAGLIGAALYWAIPALYRQYVIPVERNTSRIEDLQGRQEQAQVAFDQRVAALQERIDNLEVLQDQDKQSAADLQSALDGLGGSQGELQGMQTQTMERLDEFQAALDQLADTLDDLEGQMADLADETAVNQAGVQALNEELLAADTPLNSLRRELELLKAMELITRSRLFLEQRNEGLAEQDIELARDLLAALQPQVLEFQQDELQAIIDRLDLALGNFPARPDRAANDLELAWQLLVDGLPQSAEAAEAAAEASAEGVEGAAPEGAEGSDAPEPTPTPSS